MLRTCTGTCNGTCTGTYTAVLALVASLLLVGCGEARRSRGDVERVSPDTTHAEPGPVPVEPRWSARGTRATLREFELQVTAAGLGDDELRLALAFENVSDASFVLAGELSGEDLVLADPSGGRHSPLAVSGDLRRIDSGAGLPPGATKTGEVVFPRPAGDTFELRMPGFAPVVLSSGQIPRIERALGHPPQQIERIRAAIQESEPALDPERDAIEELLAAQASALERRDFDAYLETFAPGRRRSERAPFEQRMAVPLTDVAIRLLPKPLTTEGGRRHGEVVLRYRLDGIPLDNPFVYFLSYQFSRSGADWQVEEIREEPGRRLPWREGELAFHRSNHFLIYTSPSMQSDLVELARDAEAAYAELYRRGLPMASGYVIRFACDESFAWRPDRVSILGRAVAMYEIAGDRLSVHSRALFINACLFSQAQRLRLSPERRRVTMTHELAHLALAGDTRPYSPLWLAEGAAVYFSSDISFDATRRLARDGLARLDLDSMTRAWDPERAANAEYLFSGNVVAYLIERHGLTKLLRFYASFAELGVSELAYKLSEGTASSRAEATLDARLRAAAPASVPGELLVELTSAALEQHFGVTLLELDAEVRKWLAVKHR